MVFRQDYLYWKIIHNLVIDHQFRILKLSQDQNEIWLESVSKKGPAIVRLLRYDLNWGNWLQQDMEGTLQNAEKIRNRKHKRKIDVLNVYISTFPPVDDWQFRTENPLTIGKKGQTSLHTVLVHSDRVKESISELSALLELPLSESDEGFIFDYSILEGLKREVITVSNQRIKEERKIFEHGKPYFTYFFIAVQVFVFALLELFGGSTNPQTLYTFGAKDNLAIINGEWWRLLTPIIIHIGFLHLLMNTIALFYIGTAVERIFGKSRFLLLYIFSGFTGCLASFAFSPTMSAGASGAIFGCFGALLFFGVAHPNLFFRTMGTNVIGVVILNLAIGFIIPVVDNSGHIGGLVGGFLAASVLHLPNKRKYVQRTVALFLTITLTAVLLYVGYIVQPTSNDPISAMTLAETHLQNGEYERAYELLQRASETENPPPELYFYLSIAEVKLGYIDDAKSHLLVVTKELPNLHEAHYNLALVYTQLNEFDKAKQAVEKALEIKSENKDYLALLNRLNRQEGVE